MSEVPDLPRRLRVGGYVSGEAFPYQFFTDSPRCPVCEHALPQGFDQCTVCGITRTELVSTGWQGLVLKKRVEWRQRGEKAAWPPGAPRLPGHLIGFRRWRIRHGLALAPSGVLAFSWPSWTPGVNTAACTLETAHVPPAPGCKCGLYAYYRLPPPVQHERIVWGVVALGGPAVLQRISMRARQARIIALAAPAVGHLPPRSLVEEVAARYQVPVVDHEDLLTVALEHGREVLAKELP